MCHINTNLGSLVFEVNTLGIVWDFWWYIFFVGWNDFSCISPKKIYRFLLAQDKFLGAQVFNLEWRRLFNNPSSLTWDCSFFLSAVPRSEPARLVVRLGFAVSPFSRSSHHFSPSWLLHLSSLLSNSSPHPTTAALQSPSLPPPPPRPTLNTLVAPGPRCLDSTCCFQVAGSSILETAP